MSSTPPPHQAEKPSHYTYLKEFRVNQCPLFLQHKCTQHRPFTCFYWHFSNQRRRRPVRKRDGTFNYSADSYCSKYDETTGICQIGDDCPYIHRNTGDTERRYHLRYYKTGTCIHETDSRGNCVKNGPHCAFAHGSDDLRPPVYDVREQHGEGPGQNGNGDHLPRSDVVNLAEKIVNEDPKWLEANYVLSNYKTDVCKRPPRLCRQGYACPQYHNPKDRRRNPKKFKYRSTPCPNVKQGDDWKDPSCCEKGDGCSFCHTRTEQQFHPEIYKSTKCHDMSQTGYCPRGPFCAFAHVEQEIRVLDDDGVAVVGGGGVIDNDVVAPQVVGKMINQQMVEPDEKLNFKMNDNDVKQQQQRDTAIAAAYMAAAANNNDNNLVDSAALWGQAGANTLLSELNLMDSIMQQQQQQQTNDQLISKSFPSRLSPVSKHRTSSISGGRNEMGLSYLKAVGSERYLNDGGAGNAGNMGGAGGMNYNLSNSWSRTTMDPFSNTMDVNNMKFGDFYQPKSTVASVIDNALPDDTNTNTGGLDQKDIQQIWNNDTSTQLTANNNHHDSLFTKSSPLNIPQHYNMAPGDRFNAVVGNSLPQGSPSLFGSDANSMQINSSSFPSMGAGLAGMKTPVGGGGGGMVPLAEFERLQEKCKEWHSFWSQAKAACDAWKNEASGSADRAKMAEKREVELLEKLRVLEDKVDRLTKMNGNVSPNGGVIGVQERLALHLPIEQMGLENEQLPVLKDLQKRYKADLDAVEKHIWERILQPQNQ